MNKRVIASQKIPRKNPSMVVLKLKNGNLLIGEQWQCATYDFHVMAFRVALE